MSEQVARVDPERVRARVAELSRTRDDHYRTADILRDLADDEEREALRLDAQVRALLALTETKEDEGDDDE